MTYSCPAIRVSGKHDSSGVDKLHRQGFQIFVYFHVLFSRANDYIFRTVVRFDSVDVMDYFAACQFSIKQFFHNQHMLRSVCHQAGTVRRADHNVSPLISESTSRWISFHSRFSNSGASPMGSSPAKGLVANAVRPGDISKRFASSHPSLYDLFAYGSFCSVPATVPCHAYSISETCHTGQRLP